MLLFKCMSLVKCNMHVPLFIYKWLHPEEEPPSEIRSAHWAKETILPIILMSSDENVNTKKITFFVCNEQILKHRNKGWQKNGLLQRLTTYGRKCWDPYLRWSRSYCSGSATTGSFLTLWDTTTWLRDWCHVKKLSSRCQDMKEHVRHTIKRPLSFLPRKPNLTVTAYKHLCGICPSEKCLENLNNQRKTWE